jgi:hypothetical protein
MLISEERAGAFLKADFIEASMFFGEAMLSLTAVGSYPQ